MASDPLGNTPLIQLPETLQLLIHLHLLAFPKANDPEYDDFLFDSQSRGIGKRTKSMEDIVYFLTSVIEGENATKQLYPSYPCIQPVDTISFRNSASKYIESLRHQAIHPTSTKGKEGAWWWKDIVVRKSLLEECTGERFERVLVALSTHAIGARLRKMSSAVAMPQQDEAPIAANLSDHLRAQPSLYHSFLTAALSKKAEWTSQIHRLNHRAQELALIRTRLTSSSTTTSNAPLIPLDRLAAIRDAKRKDYMHRWTKSGQREGWDLLYDLSGFAHLDEKHEIASSELGPHDDKGQGPLVEEVTPLEPAAAITSNRCRAPSHSYFLASRATPVLPKCFRLCNG
ncbi:hypothetical protein BOTBODRAFT_52254 [Botryobasidium botryosum FD-172 SS1]|uniref:HAUS augmin-like complex subunit 6 N-terminal domain-containing protein n=1 Tax=Botryobasidium botryosum (strain FD-172 SS1) TaxID=930990 RepID=A0A067N5L2_BOTB1|nr:hypothetical protein BOTBODRAFT_52254 [Botryobasidium botryosum FD-172 SS1]